ncbi:MAG: hypothetical protein MK132_17850 [Lentisphaerales bacterium]|nr:hypothetical protein [Lentisphaerales bacterium]
MTKIEDLNLSAIKTEKTVDMTIFSRMEYLKTLNLQYMKIKNADKLLNIKKLERLYIATDAHIPRENLQYVTDYNTAIFNISIPLSVYESFREKPVVIHPEPENPWRLEPRKSRLRRMRQSAIALRVKEKPQRVPTAEEVSKLNHALDTARKKFLGKSLR